MIITDLLKYIKTKLFKNKKLSKQKNYTKKLIEIIELVLEEKFYNWNKNIKISQKQIKIIEKLCKIIFDQEFPIQYINNIVKFDEITLYLNPTTLIPRPETELIIQKIYQSITKLITNHQEILLIDFGTGSGNIIISIYQKLKKNYKILPIAIDLSFNALQTALKNCIINNTTNILLLNYSNLDILKTKTNKTIILISNPPYLTKNELKRELLHEPITSLLTPYKTYFYKKIIKFFITNNIQNFILFFEIDYKSIKKLLPYIKNTKFQIQYISRKIFLLSIEGK